jgi:hypothetical protein
MMMIAAASCCSLQGVTCSSSAHEVELLVLEGVNAALHGHLQLAAAGLSAVPCRMATSSAQMIRTCREPIRTIFAHVQLMMRNILPMLELQLQLLLPVMMMMMMMMMMLT